MTATAVTLSGLTKSYNDEQPAVRSIDLDIEPGTLVSLLGSSGCGKTTTLRMVAGLVRPTSGSILFDNADVTEVRTENRPVAMVFQKSLLFPHMTIAENVGFGLRLRKVPSADIKRRVGEMLSLVQLDGFGARRVGELSGGQEQRVSLARALIVEPKVLLLDEPLSALDANLRVQMRDLVRSVQQQIGVTTIFVTHDQEEAVNISDRIALLVDGVIEQFAEPELFYTRPRSLAVARFFGTANLLDGDADNGVFRGGFGTLAYGSGIRSGPGVLVVRQEDVEILDVEGGGEGVLRVVVERTQYLGTRTKIWVRPAYSGLNGVLQFDAPPSRQPTPGEEILIRISPDHCHVVAANGQPAAPAEHVSNSGQQDALTEEVAS